MVQGEDVADHRAQEETAEKEVKVNLTGEREISNRNVEREEVIINQTAEKEAEILADQSEERISDQIEEDLEENQVVATAGTETEREPTDHEQMEAG